MEFLSIPLILLFALIGLGLYLIGIYNAFAALKVRIREAWAQIDVQLKRRIDLIPNLMETVKGYMEHEKDVFNDVVNARTALMSANTPDEAGKADLQLGTALKSLFALAEAYPDLKAQEGFINLQKELSDTEDKVAYSRQFYNSVVREFNEKLAVFPSNIVGQIFGYKAEAFFEAQEAERNAPKVDFTQK